MSAESMKQFYDLITKDKAVSEEVKAAGANLDAVIAVAKTHGFDIDVRDFHKLAANIHNKLSKAELDAVAGGSFDYNMATAAQAGRL